MDHTSCRCEFLFLFGVLVCWFWFVGFVVFFCFFFFLFPNRKQVPFVKNTLSDENVEIILGKKNLIMNGNTFVCRWGEWMILLLRLLSQL